VTTLLVFTTLPDRDRAEALARELVERRLAACVNILAPCASMYHWDGKIETAAEIPLVAKTTEDRYAALEACIVAAHPYDLPEIVAVPVARGLPGYLAWVTRSVAPDA
jgi:periplasmic divalent cation tolerance protein